VAISRASDSSIQDGLPKYNDIWDGFTATSVFDNLATALVPSSGSTTTITFSSIPQTYTHLQIRFSAAESTGDIYFQAVYNSDTTQTNYPRHRFWANGASNGASSTINVDGTTRGAVLGAPLYSTTYHGVGVVNILDYTNTNKYTTTSSLFGQDANGSGIIELNSSIWLNTNAVTRIDFRCNLSGGGSASSTLNAGSIVSLYGIK